MRQWAARQNQFLRNSRARTAEREREHSGTRDAKRVSMAVCKGKSLMLNFSLSLSFLSHYYSLYNGAKYSQPVFRSNENPFCSLRSLVLALCVRFRRRLKKITITFALLTLICVGALQNGASGTLYHRQRESTAAAAAAAKQEKCEQNARTFVQRNGSVLRRTDRISALCVAFAT